MIDAALRAAGHRSARYTSPHLVDLTERFVIDGRPVERTTRWSPRSPTSATPSTRCAPTARLDVQPTFFEVTTAVAFELFRRARRRDRGARGRPRRPPRRHQRRRRRSRRRSPRSRSIISATSATRSRRSPSKRPASSSPACRWSSGRWPPEARERSKRSPRDARAPIVRARSQADAAGIDDLGLRGRASAGERRRRRAAARGRRRARHRRAARRDRRRPGASANGRGGSTRRRLAGRPRAAARRRAQPGRRRRARVLLADAGARRRPLVFAAMRDKDVDGMFARAAARGRAPRGDARIEPARRPIPRSSRRSRAGVAPALPIDVAAARRRRARAARGAIAAHRRRRIDFSPRRRPEGDRRVVIPFEGA